MSLRFLSIGPTPGHFPTSGFSSTEGFGSRFFVGYTSSEYFRMDGGYSVMVPPTSNAPTCGVLAPEVKTAASTHQQPTAWYLVRSVQSAPPSMPLHLPSMLLCMFGVYPIHHPILTWTGGVVRISTRPACCSFFRSPFLFGSPKRAHFRRDNFLTLSKN